MSQPPSGTLKPFALAPATPEDIHRLTHIHVVSLADDPPAQIKFPSSDNFAAPVSSMLEKQIGDPKWCIMKAVDEETGEIGSWARWKEEQGEKEGKEDEGKLQFAPGLGSHIINHTNTLYTSLSFSHNLTSYLSLRTYFTLPEFERRGMVTSLIRYGAKRADGMGLRTVVQASPRGKGIYEKVGYEVWDWSDVELVDERWVSNRSRIGEVEERYRRGFYRVWYLDRKLVAGEAAGQ